MFRYVAAVVCSMLLMTSCFAGDPAKFFQSVLPQVKHETSVPILLPSELPPPLKEGEIHFADGNGEHNKYSITLFYEESAGYAAFVGYFSGEAKGKTSFKGKKVELVNGITGYFKGKSCGGSCSPSQIEWSLDDVLYTLQLKIAVKSKDEEERALVMAANSAILGGAR